MKYARYILSVPVFIGGLCTLLGFLGQFDWRLDLLSHFRLQYLLFFAVSFVIVILLKTRILIVASLIFLILNLLHFLPFYVPPKPTVRDSGLVVFTANVQRENRQFSKLIQQVKKTNPDVIVLLEVNHEWQNAMNRVKNSYPYSISEAREDYFGVLLFSKYQLHNPRIERIGSAGIPSVVTELQINGKEVTLIGTHPLPPFNRYNTVLRNDQIEALAQFINRQQAPVVLVGDLNSTPFSSPYRRLVSETALTNCANGFGYHTTWQIRPSMPPFGLKIDHCFHTDQIVILESYVGEDIGSDHLPIINSIAISE